MSDRDFIIQEIRKLFKEQSNKNTSKVTPAKGAKPTEDHAFQVASLPSDFPKEIVAGMDRSDPGYNKGGSKVINQAAIDILGSDPKDIYTALINAGILPPNYSPSGEPFSDLSKHIAAFQERAINGLLRYQKQMKITAKDALSRLRYKPAVPTPSKKSKGLSDKEIELARSRGKITEQDSPNVAVDGKIGSRTAQLLKIYADKSSFEGLKKKAGVVPAAPVKKTTTTTSKKTTTARTTTTGTKQPCVVSINSANDLKVKTVLTILGYGSCDLKAKSRELRWRERDFTKLSDIFETESGAAGSSAFDKNYTDKKDRITRFVASPQGQIDIFNKITKSALAGAKNVAPVPNQVYGQLGTWMENAVSPMIFDLHTGLIGSPNKLVNFAYVRFGKQAIPLIYLSDHGSRPEIASFMKAVNYNRWIMEPPEKRKQSFSTPQNLNGLIRNMTDHSKNIDHFEKEILSAAKNDPKFRDSRYQSLLQDCLNICKGYRDALMTFLQKVKAFQVSPNEQIMKEMVSFGGPISISQQMLHRK